MCVFDLHYLRFVNISLSHLARGQSVLA